MTGVRTNPAVVGDLLTKRLHRFPRPAPVEAPLLAHEALKCSRRIGFRLFGTPPDIKYTRAELARFEDGDFIDSVAGEVFAQELDARTQVHFNWLPEVRLKGKADAGYRDPTRRKVIAETKSINEKGWSRCVGLWDSVPAAPKVEWLVQVGLAACSPTLDAQLVHIVLVDDDRLEVAEWIIGVDTPLDLPEWPATLDPDTGEIALPTIRDLVTAEVVRQAQILEECENGTLPARDIPGFGPVVEPPSRFEEHTAPWQCRFCQFQPTCVALPMDAVPEYGEMAP